MKVPYKKAIELSNILGALNIISVGSELFLPIIKVKSALSKTVSNYQELHKEMVSALGIEVNEYDGSLKDGTQIALANDLSKSINKLHQEEVEVPELKILTAENIISLIKENPKLNTDNWSVVYDLMLKA